MKSKVIILVAMLMASPSALMAQQSIQKMFDCIVNDGRVKVTSQNHYLDRNPETDKKEAQADVYDIMMPNDMSFKQLVKDTQWSFEKDKESAYQIKSGKNVGDNYTALAVGDGGSQSVAVGRIRGSEFIYACFLDKDDPYGDGESNADLTAVKHLEEAGIVGDVVHLTLLKVTRIFWAILLPVSNGE